MMLSTTYPVITSKRTTSHFLGHCCNGLFLIFLAITFPLSESLKSISSVPAGRYNLRLQYQTTNSEGNTFDNSTATSTPPRTYSGGEIMKAWHCHGRNQWDLVDRLRQAKIIRTSAVQRVMELVDRANYVPSTTTTTNDNNNQNNNAYRDAPQVIGLGQTISAPHMHAHVLEEIYPYLLGKEDIKLLDVGCGSGYLTATFGRWLQSGNGGNGSPVLGPNIRSGKVFGIDVKKDLVDLTRRNIRRADGDLFDTGILHVDVGDGWKGLQSEAPFDAIHVGAAAESLPYELVSQLKVGGIMITPIGMPQQIQNLYKIERISASHPVDYVAKDYRITSLLHVRYVPLVKDQSNDNNNNDL